MINSSNLFNGQFIKAPLSTKEQYKYFKLAQSGNKKAKNILLEHNLGLVAFVINKYYKDFDDETKKDLFSVGSIELWKVIQKFKIELGNEFSTYAIPSIYYSIKTYIRENKSIHISRTDKDLSVSIIGLQNDYADNHNGEELSTDELSKILGVSEKTIIRANAANQPVLSLQSTFYENNGSEILIEEKIVDENFEIYNHLERQELYNDLLKTLDKLPKKHRMTLILLFGLDGKKRTQEDVGKILNLTQSTISKIKKDALKKLKTILPDYIKEEYEQKKYSISKTNK